MLRPQALARLGRVDALVDAHRRASSIAERRWLRGLLQDALAWSDPFSVRDADVERLAAMGLSSLDTSSIEVPPHNVIVPFTSEAGPFARAFIARWTQQEAPTFLFASEASTQTVEHACGLALRRAKHVQEPSVAVAFEPWMSDALDGIEIDGASMGPAAYVAALSLATQYAVRPGTAISGLIRGQNVKSVDGIDDKALALAMRGDVRRFVVSADDEQLARDALVRCGRDDIDVHGVSTLRDLELHALQAHAVDVDLDRAVSEARDSFDKSWSDHRWPLVRERLGRLSSMTKPRPDLDVEVLVMWAAAARHSGELEESHALLERAALVLRKHKARVPDAIVSRLRTHLALTALARGQGKRARKEANESLVAARAAKSVRTQIKALGTVGIVELGAGSAKKAVKAQKSALALTHECAIADCTRSHAYLIEALGEHGADESTLTAAFEEGLSHVRARPESTQRRDEPWLRHSYAQALLHGGHYARALRALETPVVLERVSHDALLGLRVRRVLGVSLARDRKRRAQGWSWLAGSPSAYELSSASQLHGVAALNVIHEGMLRIEHGELDDDARARMRLSIERLLHALGAPDMALSDLAHRVTLVRAWSRAERGALASLVRRLSRAGY